MKAICTLLLVFLFPLTAQAEPMALVKGTIAQVRQTVSLHPAEESDEALSEKLEQIIEPVFNFDDMARRCLGKNWGEGTEQQQKEFVRLFSDLLADTYLQRIKSITDTEIKYDKERVKGKRAIVKTTVINSGQRFPIDYRMVKKKGTWRVYDVVIENISLVSNYRSEFSSIIRKEKFSGLITRLKEKKADKVQA